MKTIRLEKRENNTHAFIEVVNGDVKNAKEIVLTPKQREDIEELLNKEIEEHDMVVVTKVNVIISANAIITVGDEGTVVHIHESGEAYEVEFANKNNLVLTMYKGEIKKKV